MSTISLNPQITDASTVAGAGVPTTSGRPRRRSRSRCQATPCPRVRVPVFGKNAYRLGIGVADPMHPTEPQIDAACRELTDHFLAEAEAAARLVGFGWYGTPSSPATFTTLKAAYEHCASTGEALAVSNEHLETAILASLEANVALRFVHDVSHVRQGLSFRTEDELELGLCHVATTELAGLSPLAVRLIEADLVGQTLLYAASGKFATNQRQFDLDCLVFGIADAILLERERHGQTETATEPVAPTPSAPLALLVAGHDS
ncbi:hypothetical protein [Psychromicrobium xiongbiense]|uniref:hypothetical protein n=1 Tax=Psychromicrobium xiongbiense TaxID=3051184 RepID=UPI002556A383|nr:hypothetical protein [Psychromicrobium sp. YIM S02556]